MRQTCNDFQLKGKYGAHFQSVPVFRVANDDVMSSIETIQLVIVCCVNTLYNDMATMLKLLVIFSDNEKLMLHIFIDSFDATAIKYHVDKIFFTGKYYRNFSYAVYKASFPTTNTSTWQYMY